MIRIALNGGLTQLGFGVARSLIENSGEQFELTVIDKNPLDRTEVMQRVSYLSHFGVNYLSEMPETLMDYHLVIDFTIPRIVELGIISTRTDSRKMIDDIDDIVYRGVRKLIMVSDVSMIGVLSAFCNTFSPGKVTGIITMDTIGGSFDSQSKITEIMQLHMAGQKICVNSGDVRYLNLAPLEHVAASIKYIALNGIRSDGTLIQPDSNRNPISAIGGPSIQSELFKRILVAALHAADPNITPTYSIAPMTSPIMGLSFVENPKYRAVDIIGHANPRLLALYRSAEIIYNSNTMLYSGSTQSDIHLAAYQYAKKVVQFQGLNTA